MNESEIHILGWRRKIFYISSWKNIKLLLLPAVNFINFIRARFLYKRQTHNVHVTRKKAATMMFVQKICTLNC